MAEQKAAQRQHLRGQRRLIGPRPDGAALAGVLGEAFAACGIAATEVVAGFLPSRHEPDVLLFLAARCGTGPVLMPRTLPGSGMEWIPWTTRTPLQPDRHGLLAPAGEPDRAMVERLRAVLVPALAVDPAGHRLGQGGGYYDRALQQLRRWPTGPLRVGVVHPEGMLDAPLPHAPHDQPVDLVVCSGGWRAGPGAALSR